MLRGRRRDRPGAEPREGTQESAREAALEEAREEAQPSRRSLFGAAGLAAVAAVGGTTAAAAAGATRYEDRADARGRADGATVAELSRATSLTVLWRARTDAKVMALTFDDGPGDELTAPLLDVLREQQVRATFSLVGRRAYERRDLVRAQMRAGHELVNHSWSHPDLSSLPYAQVKTELERTDQLLSELTGRRPALIRPPYGRVEGALLQHAAQSGQSVLLWDLRLHESRLDAAGNAAYVLQHARPGSVLLGHDAGSPDRRIGVQAVPEIIRGARQRGYTFVTASELVALDAAARRG